MFKFVTNICTKSTVIIIDIETINSYYSKFSFHQNWHYYDKVILLNKQY